MKISYSFDISNYNYYTYIENKILPILNSLNIQNQCDLIQNFVNYYLYGYFDLNFKF